MFRGRKAALLVTSLAALYLLVFPVGPAGETAPTELPATETRSSDKLLGSSPEREPSTPDPAPQGDTVRKPPPAAGTMTLTAPKLGLRDVAVPTGSRQARLDREGIMHVRGTGLPWEEGSNTFIAGHALGFPETRVPHAFRDLEEMMPGDRISVRGADGRRYAFEVYDRLTVEPDDTWVTEPVEGRTVISLQTCVPIPTFEDRLIVRAEMVS